MLINWYLDNALLIFQEIEHYHSFRKELLRNIEWDLSNDDLQERADKIKDENCYKRLKYLFKQKKLNENEVSDMELVSWLDTQFIMDIIINKLDECILRDLKMLVEFQVPFTRQERIDWILCYKNNIIIVEFGSTRKNFRDLKLRKTNELLNYKEKLSNILNNNFNIYTYAFLYKLESIKTNNNLNDSINEFIDFICFICSKEQEAFEQLLGIKLVITRTEEEEEK